MFVSESYNEAVTFSSGKGLAHTLARRAGFLLQTQEHMLALRDLHLGDTCFITMIFTTFMDTISLFVIFSS